MRSFIALFAVLAACGEKDHTHSEDSTADDSATDDSTADDSAEDSSPAGLEIVGSYTDSWGGSHTVTEETWASGSASWAIAAYDNEGDHLVAQNAATNTYFPGLWSRYDWLWSGAELYYCQSAYDAATQADAQAASADRTDLGAGCGGFGWTLLTPAQ